MIFQGCLEGLRSREHVHRRRYRYVCLGATAIMNMISKLRHRSSNTQCKMTKQEDIQIQNGRNVLETTWGARSAGFRSAGFSFDVWPVFPWARLLSASGLHGPWPTSSWVLKPADSVTSYFWRIFLQFIRKHVRRRFWCFPANSMTNLFFRFYMKMCLSQNRRFPANSVAGNFFKDFSSFAQKRACRRICGFQRILWQVIVEGVSVIYTKRACHRFCWCPHQQLLS